MQNFAQVESGQRTDLASGELVQNFAQAATGQKTRALELKALGERRGRPKQGGEDISQNFGELFGKKNYEVAADKAGFSSAEWGSFA